MITLFVGALPQDPKNNAIVVSGCGTSGRLAFMTAVLLHFPSSSCLYSFDVYGKTNVTKFVYMTIKQTVLPLNNIMISLCNFETVFIILIIIVDVNTATIICVQFVF